MIEIIDALLDLIDTDDAITIDRTAAAPFTPEPKTIYAWEEGSAQRSIGTGEVREDFSIALVYVVDNEGEESVQRRSRAVSEALDAKRKEIFDLVRLHAQYGPWSNIAARADADLIRQLQVRGIGIFVDGYRLIEDTTEG